MNDHQIAICARQNQLLIGLYNFGSLDDLEKQDVLKIVQQYCFADMLNFKLFDNGKIGYSLPGDDTTAIVGILAGRLVVTKVTGNKWNVDL